MTGRIAIALLGLTACMEPGRAVPPPDARPTPDARDAAEPDVRPEVAPRACDQSPHGAFDCVPVSARPFASVCTDEAIAKLIASCLKIPFDGTVCAAARAEFVECGKCTSYFGSGYRPVNVAACMKAIAPKSGCGTTWACARRCENAACSECGAWLEGDGDGGFLPSEYDECAARAATGDCADRIAAEQACEADPQFAPCIVNDDADLARYLRGACRDGGDWVKAAADAGTD